MFELALTLEGDQQDSQFAVDAPVWVWEQILALLGDGLGPDGPRFAMDHRQLGGPQPIQQRLWFGVFIVLGWLFRAQAPENLLGVRSCLVVVTQGDDAVPGDQVV